MSVRINSNCVNCDLCINVCPEEAIYYYNKKTIVEESRCTECVDKYDSPVCAEVCSYYALEWGPDKCNPSHKDRVVGDLI